MQKDCTEKLTGPFPPGTYDLRATPGAFFPLADAVKKATAKVTITK